MDLSLTATQRAALDAAAAAERRPRTWQRYQAVVLLAEGQPPATVAHSLTCSVASIYNWVAAWRRAGVAGLTAGPHPGVPRRLDAAGARLGALLTSDPQAHGHRATGWTVALPRTDLAAAGYPLRARTVRRAVHRLGSRWKRPQDVLGRPDPAYAGNKGA